MKPLDGSQYRVVVHARNFATTWQRYSLAISGCLDNKDQTRLPSAAPQLQNNNALSDNNKPFGSSKTVSSCQNEETELFELELVNAEGNNGLSWDVIMPTPDKGSEVILSSNGVPKYEENNTHYYYSACLEHNRYRFKMLNIGNASYRISVGGEEILNSMSMNHPTNLYSFRFRVTAKGYAPITRKRTSQYKSQPQ